MKNRWHIKISAKRISSVVNNKKKKHSPDEQLFLIVNPPRDHGGTCYNKNEGGWLYMYEKKLQNNNYGVETNKNSIIWYK